MAPSIGVTLKMFLGSKFFYTVYAGKLQNIALVLRIALNRPIGIIKKVTIFTNNQAVIQSSSNPTWQSGQQILWYIVHLINTLKKQGIEAVLQWVLAHVGVKRNELVDVVAK